MTTERLKEAAAALELVRDGMRLGLGTGSTARHFVTLPGERVTAGLHVSCVPTSEATAAQARTPGIPLTTLEHGLFIGLCSAAFLAAPDGVAVLARSA